MLTKNTKWILVLVLILFIFPIVSAKELKITDYTINYRIQQSGNVSVTEALNYQLSGCFTELYLQRPNLIISEPNGACSGATCTFEYKQYGTVSGDPELILKGNFCDTNVVAYFNYELAQQIRELEDGVQFYYQVYPGKTSVSTDVNINISFPGAVNKITQFIHSKDYFSQIIYGELRISKHVGAYEIIEVNLLMPKEWFSENNLYHYPDRNYTQAQIIEEEKNWKEGYNQYTKANVKNEAPLGIILLYLFLMIGFPILLLFIIWLIFGKEIPESKTGYLGIYERDLPGEEDPVQAHYLITGELSKNWFSSAIMYLVWKKQYELVKEKDKTLFSSEKYSLVRIKDAKEVTLPNYVSEVDKFFKEYYPDGTINLDDLRSGQYKSKDATDFFSKLEEKSNFINDFRALQIKVQKETNRWANKNKYFDKTGMIVANIAIILYAFIFSRIINFIFFGYIFPTWVTFVFWISAIVIIIANIATRSKISFSVIFGRFSKEGRVKNLQWTNFKKYITDFSLIKQYPPQHVILWEEYMVYATAFGVAKEASKALKTAMPEEVSKNEQFVVYSAFAMSSFSTTMGNSSSGGFGGHGGGGFGGGGGGGGGAGAR
ncbi:MAG: DUF2207 domain-containing protein [archaeon]|jgi:uncharacterized membrane protein